MEEEARAQMFDIMSTIQNLRGELRTEEEMLNTVKDLKRHLEKQSSDMDKLEKTESRKEEAMATCLQNKLAEVKQRNVELEDVCKDLELKMAQQHNNRQATIDILQKVFSRDSEAKNKDLEDKILKENIEKNKLLEKDSEILQHINEKQALTAQCEELSKRLEDMQVAFDVSKQLDVYKSETERYKKENVALQQAIASEKKSSQECQTEYERAVLEFKLDQNLAREIQKSKDEEVKQLNEKLMKESGKLKSTEEGHEKLRVMLKSKNKEMGSTKEELQSREVEVGKLRKELKSKVADGERLRGVLGSMDSDIRRLKAEVEREKDKAMKMSEKLDRKEIDRRQIEDKLWRKSKELLSRDKDVDRLHRELQSKDEEVVRLKSNIKRNENDEEGEGDEKGARTKPAEAASKLLDDEEEEETDSDEEDVEEKAKGVSKLIEIKSPNGSIIKKKVTVLVLPERKSERKQQAKGRCHQAKGRKGKQDKKKKDGVQCPCGQQVFGGDGDGDLIQCNFCLDMIKAARRK